MSEHILKVKNFPLDRGGILPEAEFFYRTYGAKHLPVALVFHALTGNADAAEWWPGLVGEGKLLDPKKYFIICANSLGSCYGTTGPESSDLATGKKYGKDFPVITTGDIARQHLAILDSLGIDRVALGIGGSMGGMILLELALAAPDLFEKIVPISVGASHSAWRLAFSSLIRKTIETFGSELGEDGFIRGMHLARQFAMTSYRSGKEFDGRFGRDTKNGKFEIENYLEYQGDKIVSRFSPHSYTTLTRAMELYDITGTLDAIKARALFIGATSDILYSEDELKETARIIGAGYRSLDAPFGHDSFLIATEKLTKLVRPFITQKIQQEVVA